jgi:hypothetical protein
MAGSHRSPAGPIFVGLAGGVLLGIAGGNSFRTQPTWPQTVLLVSVLLVGSALLISGALIYTSNVSKDRKADREAAAIAETRYGRP